MNITFYKHPRDIPARIHPHLASLTLFDGMMWPELNTQLQEPTPVRGERGVVIAWDGPVPRGWMLVDRWGRAMMFVDHYFRRRGIATALLRCLSQQLGRPVRGHTREPHVLAVMRKAHHPQEAA